MDKRKVIFDTDIGCDDAVCLLALLKEPTIDLIGITCVRGNIPVEDVTNNALKFCHLLDRDIPVYMGCKEPMIRNLFKGREQNTLMQRIRLVVDGEEILIHEKDFKLPLPDKKAEDKHACSYLVDTLRNTKEKIDIVAVGPLTNIAMAIKLDPSIVDSINAIYIMGGGIYIGNRTPVAEANFYDDPEAAEIVLTSGANIYLLPIEACEEGVTLTLEDLDSMKKINNKVSNYMAEMLKGYIDRCNTLFKGDATSCCAYDLAAALALIDPKTCTETRYDICHVDISGGMGDGQLIVDRRGHGVYKETANLVYHMDPKLCKQYLFDYLKDC